MIRFCIVFIFLLMNFHIHSDASLSSTSVANPSLAKIGSEVTITEHIQFPPEYTPELTHYFNNLVDVESYKINSTTYNLKTNTLDIVFKVMPQSFGTIEFCPGILDFTNSDKKIRRSLLLAPCRIECPPTQTSGLEFSKPVPFNFDKLVLIDSENRKRAYENEALFMKELQQHEKTLARRELFFSTVYSFFFGLFIAVLLLWIVYQFDLPLYPKPRKQAPKNAATLFDELLKNKDLSFSKKEAQSAQAIRLSLEEVLILPAQSLTLEELKGRVQKNANVSLDDKAFLLQAFDTLEKIEFAKTSQKESALTTLTESFYSWFTKVKSK